MDILVLASEYPYEKDTNADRTKVVGYFAREWVRQGHRVLVIVNSSTFPTLYYKIGNLMKKLVSKTFDVSGMPEKLWARKFSYDDSGVQVENIPIMKFVPHGKFSKYALNKQSNEILSTLESKEFSPDVVTGHWVNPQLMLIHKIAEKYDARSAFIFHADYGEKTYNKFNVQKYIDGIDHVGFRSQSAICAAKKYMQFKAEPFVAASGIPDKYIRNEIIEKSFSEYTTIISAGRLLEYKKIDVALQAAIRAFPNGNYDFAVAGNGPLKAKLQNFIDENRQEKHVHLLGQIERDSLQKLMRERDVFVLISKHETFGLVYLEAMLQGCIVIASKFGGVDGIIKDGENGFLCEEGNEEELVQIFTKIKNLSKEKKISISQRAIETAKEYTESNVARSYLDKVST